MRNLVALLGDIASGPEARGRIDAMCEVLRGSGTREIRVEGPSAQVTYLGAEGRDQGRGGVHADEKTGLVVAWEGLPRLGTDSAAGPETDLGLRMLECYRERGLEMFSGWSGIFSAVLWDSARGRALAVHDPFSHRPLFVASLPDGLAVSTRLRALLTLPQVSREIDPEAVYHFLYFSYGVAPETPLRAVRRVPAATVAVWEDGQLSFRPYWDLVYSGERTDDLAAATNEARRLLSGSVDRCLEGSESPAVFLSGGVDSGVIAGLASRRRPDLTTICFGFGEESRSEYDAAQAVADHLQTRHVEAVFDGQRLLEHAGELAWSLDVPNAGVVLPFFAAREARRLGVDVALNGMSADLSFGSGDVEWKMKRLDDLLFPLRWLPGPTREATLKGMRRVGLQIAEKSGKLTRLRNALRLLAIYANVRTGHLNFACSTREEEVRTLFAPSLTPSSWAHPDAVVKTYVDQCTPTNTANLLAYVALGLLSSDGTVPSIPAVSASVDLEVRFPYLDAELLGYIASLPTSMRFLQGTPKPMLRTIASELIPGLVARRPARAFRMPMVRWLQGPLKPLVDDALSREAIEARGLFGVDRVQAFLQAWWSSGGTLTAWHLVWGLTMLELWFRVHVDRPPSSTPASTAELCGEALDRRSRPIA